MPPGFKAREKRRAQRLDEACVEFARVRHHPVALDALLKRLAGTTLSIWTVAETAAGAEPLTDEERALIAERVAPHLVLMKPRSVRLREPGPNVPERLAHRTSTAPTPVKFSPSLKFPAPVRQPETVIDPSGKVGHTMPPACTPATTQEKPVLYQPDNLDLERFRDDGGRVPDEPEDDPLPVLPPVEPPGTTNPGGDQMHPETDLALPVEFIVPDSDNIEGSTVSNAKLMIPPKLIALHNLILKHEIRESRDEEHKKTLTAKIKANGFQGAILGYQLAGDLVGVIAGWTRVECARDAGLSHIPAVVYPQQPDEATVIEWALDENEMRADLNPIDTATAWAKLKKLKGWTDKELARNRGVAAATVSRTFALSNRLHPDLQALVSAVTLAPKAAYHISRLTKEIQVEFYTTLPADATAEDVEDAVNAKLADLKGQAREKPVRAEVAGMKVTLPGSGEKAVTAIQQLLAAVRKCVAEKRPLSDLDFFLRA